MKKIYAAVVLSVGFLFCSAQKMSKDSLLNLISDEVCVEMSKSTDKLKKENIDQQLGLMLMPAILKHLDEIQAIYKIEDINEKNMYEVGKDVGMRLAVKCESFLKLVSNNLEEFQSFGTSKKKNTKSSSTVSGNFVKLTTAEISYFEVKTISGKTEKLFWMGYFDGADDLSTSVTSLTNKKVRVEYEEKEVYKPSLKDYIKIKVVTKFEVL